MAGHMIYYNLLGLKKYKILTVCFRNKISKDSIILDMHNIKEVKIFLQQVNPDYIINCIGVLVNAAKKSTKDALYLNAYFPHLLVQLINETNPSTRLIHISSDCVFSGIKGSYSDSDIKDALDVYGMTKNLGEINDNKNITIRTSIIGPELKRNGEGLFHWIFSQKEKKVINGYEKSIWSGVTTLELSKAISKCIEHNITGLYHLSNGEKISKYMLIKSIIDNYSLNISVKKVEGVVSDKSIFPTLIEGFNYLVPSYDIMIKELYQYMSNNKNLYHFYLG